MKISDKKKEYKFVNISFQNEIWCQIFGVFSQFVKNNEVEVESSFIQIGTVSEVSAISFEPATKDTQHFGLWR